MNRALHLCSALCIFLLEPLARAQHCAPITQSYLSEISVKHVGTSVKVRVEYTKQGGQLKQAYQGYLLAYMDRHDPKLPPLEPEPLIDKSFMLPLHTQLMKRNADGRYEMEVTLDPNDFARRIIKHAGLTDGNQVDSGGWGSYDQSVRLAVFVPFLEDREHSTLEGLPEDRHECNYADERALVYQTLPYEFRICFGVVQAVKLKDGEYRIEINSAKPPKRKIVESTRPRAPADASPRVTKWEVGAATLVDRLMLNASKFEIDLGKENADKRYHIRFERWVLGKMVESAKSKSFPVNPETGKDMLLMSFPSPPQRLVFMGGQHSGWVFREPLPVKFRYLGFTGFDVIEQVSADSALGEEGLMLAYLVSAGEAPADDGDEAWPNYRSIDESMAAYNREFERLGLADRDIVVFRLFAR